MKLAHLFAAAALCLPMTAMAELSYSYLELGYRYSDFGDEEGDGFDLEVNFLAGDTFFFTANTDEVEYDNDLHLDRFGLGFGAHFNIFEKTDIYGIASYEDFEFDIPGATDFQDKGWGGELGLRYSLNDDWEFRAAGKYSELEDESFEIESSQFIGTAVYNLSPRWAVVGEYIGGEMDFTTIDRTLSENNFRVALRTQF